MKSRWASLELKNKEQPYQCSQYRQGQRSLINKKSQNRQGLLIDNQKNHGIKQNVNMQTIIPMEENFKKTYKIRTKMISQHHPYNLMKTKKADKLMMQELLIKRTQHEIKNDSTDHFFEHFDELVTVLPEDNIEKTNPIYTCRVNQDSKNSNLYDSTLLTQCDRATIYLRDSNKVSGAADRKTSIPIGQKVHDRLLSSNLVSMSPNLSYSQSSQKCPVYNVKISSFNPTDIENTKKNKPTTNQNQQKKTIKLLNYNQKCQNLIKIYQNKGRFPIPKVFQFKGQQKLQPQQPQNKNNFIYPKLMQKFKIEENYQFN